MVMPSKQFSNVHSGRPSAMLGTDNYAYHFDNIGNRMISAEDGTDKNYAANQLNQYTAINSELPTYDDDGNMLAAHGWTLTWDAENRLVSAVNGTARLEFVYDAYSRRREKKVYAGDILTKHEKYLYNGYKMIAAFDALNEDARIMTFLWQPLELDIPLCMTYNNETYYYLADGNKNITGLFDSTGARVATYTYAPFGELLSASGTMASVNPFRFSSEQYDTETTLVYYNYRYYSPVLGRWLSRDPVEEKGGWNLYTMLRNHLLEFYDKLGLTDAQRMPFDGKHPNVRGCSTAEHCSENFRRLFQWLTTAENRRAKDFLKKFLEGKDAEIRWNNHLGEFRKAKKQVAKCLQILQVQIKRGQCVPPPPDCKLLPDYQERYNWLTDPGEFPKIPAPSKPIKDPVPPIVIVGLLGLAILATASPFDGILGDIAAWGALGAALAR